MTRHHKLTPEEEAILALLPNPLESNRLINVLSAKKRDYDNCPFCGTTNVMQPNRAVRRANKGKRVDSVLIHLPGCPRQPRPTHGTLASGDKPGTIR